jgi:hypothetical protein
MYFDLALEAGAFAFMVEIVESCQKNAGHQSQCVNRVGGSWQAAVLGLCKRDCMFMNAKPETGQKTHETLKQIH